MMIKIDRLSIEREKERKNVYIEYLYFESLFCYSPQCLASYCGIFNKTLERIISKMETESANQHTIFRQRCQFCGGDHWNDLCLDYATVEVRNQLLEKKKEWVLFALKGDTDFLSA